jgi:hypothetical protein
VVEGVGDRFEVRHQRIHRAFPRLGDGQGSGIGVQPGEQAAKRIAESLPQQPQRHSHQADDEVQDLGRTMEDAILAARAAE